MQNGKRKIINTQKANILPLAISLLTEERIKNINKLIMSTITLVAKNIPLLFALYY